MTTKQYSGNFTASGGALLCVLTLGLTACASSSSTAPAASTSVAKPAAAASSSSARPAAAAPAASGGATSVSATAWSEQFSASDASSFFSASYAALPGDAKKPLYAIAAGTPTVSGGTMVLANARFTVGALGDASTASGTPGGIFNMNGKSCTLTVNVKERSSAGNFFVYVDNNTTSQGNSPHGNASRAVSVPAASLQVGANTFKLEVSTAGFNRGSFLQLRADSAASVTLDSVSLACP